MTDWMTLAELAEASGVPARTIRFYIARGLLDGPAKAGRGAAYTSEHLDRLEQIRTLQSDGRTLTEIAQRFSLPQPTAWWQHALADDVIVLAKADASPWRTKQIRAAIEEFARRLEQPAKTKGVIET